MAQAHRPATIVRCLRQGPPVVLSLAREKGQASFPCQGQVHPRAQAEEAHRWGLRGIPRKAPRP
eukprot:13527257-Alexandrium_andersonii.AAC.1